MQFIEFKECYAAMYFWMSLAINVSTLRDPPLHHRFDTRQGRFPEPFRVVGIYETIKGT